MFHEQYAFYSSTSRYMQRHFEAFAHAVMKDALAGRADPFVVELGSNDGIMLRHFQERGMRHLGVEPSTNVADVARSQASARSARSLIRKLADDIVAEHGRADAILAANVMCHIPDLPGVAAGVQRLLKPDGVFIFEDPYLGDMIAKTSYDQIYDEHVFIFSATSVRRAFAPMGSNWSTSCRRSLMAARCATCSRPKAAARFPKRSMRSLLRSRRSASTNPRPMRDSKRIANARARR